MSSYKLHTDDFEILLPERIANNEQPPFILTIGPALTMCIPIVLMALLSSLFFKGRSNFMYITLITSGTGCIMGAVWGVANYCYRKKSFKKKLMDSALEYEKYLEETKSYLDACVSDNREFLKLVHPHIKELLNDLDIGSLFKRYIKDEDYLFIRIALGVMPFQMNVYVTNDKKMLFKSEDRKRAESLASEYSLIENVPVGIDLKNDKYIGIGLSISDMSTYEVILSIIMQIIYYHSPADVKIALIYDATNELQKKLFEAVKWYPHLWSDGRSIRYVAGDSRGMETLLPSLKEAILKDERYFIVFILNESLIKDETAYQLFSTDKGLSYLSVFFLNDKCEYPSIVKSFINNSIYKNPDAIPLNDGCELGWFFANKEIGYSLGGGEIPAKVDFLSLYDAESIDDVDICELWRNNHPENRIKVPIGYMGGRRKLYLDVHEKFHGPHGLIAGTTGSGKSELIETYVLSLCMSFSPEEINFFLIDYKGGGTGCEISRLPHCAGSISNLSGNQINRAMKAISSENKRRQRLLSMANVNHVDAYEKLYRENKVDEPMPHLILIIDEFAELKKEMPDFMAEIISLAAVGRSLGIHLILATQKPAGVVDDKIWSNSNFKLCLRVQDKQDSMDMLHKADAAYLSRPGQCYIEIGNNEYYEQFQTGYCGGYLLNKEDKNKEVLLVDDNGSRHKGSVETDFDNKDTVLKLMVDRIIDTSAKMNNITARKLWINELPDKIYFSDLVKEENFESGRYPIGLFDDPANQRQGMIFYEPAIHGHMFLVGGPVTGKSSFLTMLISQIKNPDGFLLVDLSQKNIFEYKNKKECIGYLDSSSGIDIFFYHLKRLFKARKENDYSGNIFIIIDNVLSFKSALRDDELDYLYKLLSEAIGCGIFFVISGNAISDIGTKLFNKIKTGIAFELNDRFLYGDILRQYHLNVYPTSGVPGRCLVKTDGKVLECQMAIEEMNEAISDEANEMVIGDVYRFPHVDDKASVELFIGDVKKSGSDILYIGYSLKSGYLRGAKLNKGGSFVVMGEPHSGQEELLEVIKMTYMSECMSLENVLELYDEVHSMSVFDDKSIVLIEDMNATIKRIYEDDRYEDICGYLCECIKGKRTPIVVGVLDANRALDVSAYELYKLMVEYGQGICMGGNTNNQRIIDFSDLGYTKGSMRLDKGNGYMRLHDVGKSLLIKVPMDNKEDLDDFC